MRVTAAALLGLLAVPMAGGADDAILGFTPEGAARQRTVEAALFPAIDAARCQAHHHELTRTPHTAGTPGAHRVTEYVAAQMRAAGLQTEVVRYDVMLASPRRVEVEMTAPTRVTLARGEEPIPEDPELRDPTLSPPWHAYSPSGTFEGEVVFVNHGRAQDYDALARIGVDVKGKIVLARHFKGYRGGKSQEAERRGAIAMVTYSDPAEDGWAQGDVYPKGPWGPESHVQRGANVYDFVVPGDPLTPGWASVAGAKRIDAKDVRILPSIPSVPLSFRDARVLLEALGGPARPARDWQGAGPFTYHVGPGPVRLRLSLDIPREVRPIENIIARLPGADPDPAVARQVILMSNHHDAWTFGGVDPSSGTATALELARALGALAKAGHRPRRTIVFGIWDAEEFTLTGSTEWGEEHRETLAKDAVACLNVDASTSGDRLSVSAVPSLRPFIWEAARAVPDPAGRGSVYDVWKGGAGENIRAYGVRAGVVDTEPTVNVLGSGSDYTVFFNHIGVPSLDMLFDGPYGVYHSSYDTHGWMSRFGDPGFRYHAAMARLWGLMALRLANADVLPFDYGVYGRDLATYLDDVEALARERKVALDLAEARRAVQALADARIPAAGSGAKANAGLMAAERALLHPDGLPDRPWFKHLVYAPLPSYEAETLPGIREAVVAGDAGRAQAQAGVFAAAVRRATEALSPKP